MKRIMVTGGAGFIGSNFIRYMLDAHSELNIVNFDKLTYAGNPDNLRDLDPERHLFVQGDIAHREALQQALEGCDTVVYFSTDFVFDGESPTPYEPEDPINPQGVYAESKAAGEAAVRASGDRHLIVRTAWLYGPGGNNLVEKILATAAGQPSLKERVADPHRRPGRGHAGPVRSMLSRVFLAIFRDNEGCHSPIARASRFLMARVLSCIMTWTSPSNGPRSRLRAIPEVHVRPAIDKSCLSRLGFRSLLCREAVGFGG